MTQSSNKYDLEERTATFGENVLKLSMTIKKTSISSPIINQLVRSATSVGVNYQEANGASSKKDFHHKIYICKKETQETKHWLRMLIVVEPNKLEDIEKLQDECQQLVMIFQKITSTLRNEN